MKEKPTIRHTRDMPRAKYEELVQLSKKANMLIVLELLTALYYAKDNLEKRDRLWQTIMYIRMHSPCRKSLGLEQMSDELLADASSDDSLLMAFLDLASSLPMRWAEDIHYRHYASLDGTELLELIDVLIEQTSFRKRVGARIVIMRRYFQICNELLILCNLNHEALLVGTNDPSNHGAIWCSFLISKALLGGIPVAYDIIRSELNLISLPPIPFFDIGDGHWLLSKELVTQTLLCAYMNLLEYCYGCQVPLRA